MDRELLWWWWWWYRLGFTGGVELRGTGGWGSVVGLGLSEQGVLMVSGGLG